MHSASASQTHNQKSASLLACTAVPLYPLKPTLGRPLGGTLRAGGTLLRGARASSAMGGTATGRHRGTTTAGPPAPRAVLHCSC